MLRMWLEFGHVSEDNINAISSCWTNDPERADFAMAIRFATLAKITEDLDRRTVRERIVYWLKSQCDAVNSTYNISSRNGMNMMLALSVFLDYEEAYALVSAVSGSRELHIDTDWRDDGTLEVLAEIIPRKN